MERCNVRTGESRCRRPLRKIWRGSSTETAHDNRRFRPVTNERWHLLAAVLRVHVARRKCRYRPGVSKAPLRGQTGMPLSSRSFKSSFPFVMSAATMAGLPSIVTREPVTVICHWLRCAASACRCTKPGRAAPRLFHSQSAASDRPNSLVLL